MGKVIRLPEQLQRLRLRRMTVVAVSLLIVAAAIIAQMAMRMNSQSPTVVHSHVITTVFWAGEPANTDNGHIPNAESAWDDHWQQHFGGVDTPQQRMGYRPTAFIPQENAFYFALPYNDLTTDGSRKASAQPCLKFTPTEQPDDHSWCKNSWIAITHGSNTVYAQWEDVGPFEENDTSYVFGTAHPCNKKGEKAGLDVSPAVRDYLGLKDVDNTSWNFVKATDVPEGPWRTRITTTLGYTID